MVDQLTVTERDLRTMLDVVDRGRQAGPGEVFPRGVLQALAELVPAEDISYQVSLASFVAHTHLDWRGWLRTRLWWSIAAGAVVGFAIVRNVFSEASMAHPSGSFYWFELAWRGVLYGTVDALSLFVFPATVAYLLLRDSDHRRRLRFAGLTLVLTMGVTAAYHLGYPQFRGSDLVQPEIGALIATIPTALTGNPAGAIVVHDVFHVAANVHTYRSATFLPPDLDGYPERGGGTTGVALAALWVVLAGTVIYVERHRLFPTSER